MSTTIPGTTIEVDHYMDRTWKQEVLCLHNTDYQFRFWRERIGFADAEETEIVYHERGDIPARRIDGPPASYDAGKPERFLVFASDAVGPTGQAIAMEPLVQALDPSFDAATFTFADVPNISRASIDRAVAALGQRRILDLRLGIGDIAQDEYDAAIDGILVVSEF